MKKKLYDKIEKEIDLKSKDILLKEFYTNVYNNFTALPLFHPKQIYFYNKNIKPFSFGALSPLMTTINLLKGF